MLVGAYQDVVLLGCKELDIHTPAKGPTVKVAANRILQITEKATKTRLVPLGDFRHEIDVFNQSVREAHSETIASQDPGQLT